MTKLALTLTLSLVALTNLAKADQNASDNLNSAIEICDSMISDASSGQYTSYPANSVDETLYNISGYVQSAQQSTQNANAMNILNSVQTRISKIISNDNVNGGAYADSSVVNLFESIEASLKNAESEE